MKVRGRMMLLLTLVVAVVLSMLSYKGIGTEKKLSVHQIEQGLDLSGGVDIVYQADKETVTDAEMKAAISLLQGRLDWNGWTEAEVAKEGDKRIRVQIPGVENAEEAIQQIGQTAQLSFVDEAGNILLTGDMVKDASKQVGAVDVNSPSQPYVALEFNEEGKKLFAEATKNNIGKVIYIVMDDEIISAPTVQTAITDGQAMITGQFGGEEAEELASLIRAGSLPFDLNVVQMKNVGARLGTDALSTGIKAGIVGIALVLAYMLFSYKLLGFAADWALVIYVGLELVLRFRTYNRKKVAFFIFGLCLIAYVGVTFNIGNAVLYGLIVYTIMKIKIEKKKPVSFWWLMLIFAAINLVLDFVV